MTYLANFQMTPITLVSTLALSEEQRDALNTRIDEIHATGDFLGEPVVTLLESNVTQITSENGLQYKIGDTIYGPQDLLAPILNEHQSCRAVTISKAECGLILNIDDIAFNKHGLLTAEETLEQTSTFNTPFSDLKNVTDIPETELFKIHGLSGLQWHRADTSADYVATNRFKISAENARKLQVEINQYEWGEYEPEVDFNEESETAFISGYCTDHGTLADIDNEDEEISETIELSDLLVKFAASHQTIEVLDLAEYKYDSYLLHSHIVV